MASLALVCAVTGCSDDPAPADQPATGSTKETPADPPPDATVAADAESAISTPVAPERTGDPDEGGPLDLPMPDASVVTITGRDEDPSLGVPNALSNAGRYRVALTSVGEIFVGHPFEMAVSVEQTEGGTPALRRMRITPDAYMPQHFHGMNVVPLARRTGEGEYTVEGMAFHMNGLWEVYIDVTDLGVAERAQFTFGLE